MTKIHFSKDFDYRVYDYMTIAYPAGQTVEVEDECAVLAVSAGAANYSDFEEDDLIEGRFGDSDYFEKGE